MKTSREQARGEGNCAISLGKVRVTERGKEPANVWVKCESVDCCQRVISYSNAFLTEYARLRTETSYKAGRSGE